MKLLGIYWLLQALVVSALHANVPELRGHGHTQTVPSKPFPGNVNANTISKHDNLDGPQLSAVNESSYEWWYFDAVSTDRLSSLTIVFFTALASGFAFVDLTPDVTVVGIDFLFPNGTTNSIMLKADEAIITTVGQGASAVFENSGAKWTGTFDLSSYAVEINAPESGIVGTFDLKSLAPAHYACGKAHAGQRMMVAPNIGWSNAIPDAAGEVDFEVNGEKFQFNGSAYHDHNWGAQPFQDAIIFEHWGRGRLGNYSIVWFTVSSAPDGRGYRAIYVAAHGHVLTASCSNKSFSLAPLYTNRTASSEGTLDGYALEVNLDSGDVLSIRVHIQQVAVDAAPLYVRRIGSMVGRLNGGEIIRDGVALFEEFDLSDLQ
ncbi:hypothetical protein BGZ57DRAFT_762719 [Hyaloscypha finlandica]|nr:hypothetical protein BGZ57DRAFT_762719 [Hyaloscypha finlandica]